MESAFNVSRNARFDGTDEEDTEVNYEYNFQKRIIDRIFFVEF
jgi:hypothetical protein